MSTYTVVITPERTDVDTVGGHAQATVRIETGGSTPRITEMTIRSTAPGGLSTHDLPQIDLAAIVHALACGVRAVTPESTPTHSRPASAGSNQVVARPGPGDGEALGTNPVTSHLAEQTELLLPGAGQPLQTKPVRQLQHGSGRVNDTDRPYRRMPDVVEIIATYERIGTVTGLAEHYGVPRHTAQGWMGRARKMGSQ